MESWQEDIIHELTTVQCEEVLFKVLVDIARKLDFDYCAYGLRTPIPVSRPEFVVINNYPKNWQKRYYENKYLSIDPTVSHGVHSLEPIVWDDKVFVSVRDFWEEARSYGLRFGWAQSSRDVHGVAGMLTLARSGEPLIVDELREKSLKMSWLAQCSHFGMSRIISNKLLPETDIALTKREVRVLQWTADGKTSSDISKILGITERTVNYHINNVIKKLGTTNKVAATVRAVVLGILQ
jgi:LuxR family transcriptional regulator